MNEEIKDRWNNATEMLLARIDPIHVMDKISRFRKLNIDGLNDEELHEEIQKTLLNNNLFVYITNLGSYNKNTVFYRVRRLRSNNISEMGFSSASDFWEPPSERVPLGRLNKKGESLLYTCPGYPQTAIQEMHLTEGSYFALIKYIAKAEIKVNIIGGTYDYEEIGFSDKNAIIVHELYNSFLRDEFSRDVGKGTEFLYRVSEIIAKDYFDLPKEVQDAWCYSSVQNKSNYNVCFRPEVAHRLLRLDGAMICKKHKDNSIRPEAIAIASEATGEAEFYELGTEVQKRVFPEIVFIDN